MCTKVDVLVKGSRATQDVTGILSFQRQSFSNPFFNSIEGSSYAYLQGFGRSLAAAQVVEGTE
jgi:hypothetical protein